MHSLNVFHSTVVSDIQSRMTTAVQDRARGAAAFAAGWLRHTGRAIVAAVPRHGAIYALVIVTYAAAKLQSYLLGRPLKLGLAGMVSIKMLIIVGGIITFWLACELVKLWRSGYQGSPTLALIRKLFEDMLTPGRVSNSLHAFIASGIFAVGFTTTKANIPLTIPFSWDDAFIELDRVMHFGVLPHEILAPLFQYPLVTFVMNVTYNMWFLVLMGFFVWQGFREKDTPLRQRFLLAYLLCWFTGTGIAGTIFSSAGPCFYGRLFPGPDPYAELMAYLAHADTLHPIWALSTQDMLWESYVTSEGMISGISAMPSMHVATTVIFFLCARAAGIAWLTWATGIFAVMIQLGSVLLAWHYAVDGYAGALLALGCWWIAGWWVGRDPLSSRPS